MMRNMLHGALVTSLTFVFIFLGGAGSVPVRGQAADAVVSVEGGQLSGAPSPLGDDVMVYRGVPFAAPPVGDLRWRPPRPAPAWDGVRVTIFGESAGSWSVNQLMAMPLARGLFHAAIGESGGGFGSRGGAKPKAEIETAGERFVEALLGEGVTPSLEALRSASADQVQAVASDRALSTATVDGWVFPDTVYNIFAAGRQHDVPVIVGSNADETSILGGAAGADTLEQYRESIRNEYGEHADAFFETFPANTDEQAQQARVASGTDATFGWEMRTWARMMETVSSPAYLYFFSRIPPAPDADRYGAYHTAEIPYVFDNFGVSPHPYANRDYTDTDRRLSDILASYWVNMAATGNPNSEGLPDWPAYDPEADAALHIGDTIGVEAGIRKERLDFFDRYYAAQRDGND